MQGNARKINFCQWCGGPTKHEIPDGEEKMRAICTVCGKIAYQNPKMVILYRNRTFFFISASANPKIKGLCICFISFFLSYVGLLKSNGFMLFLCRIQNVVHGFLIA
jgi:hypothetical protein